MLPSNSHEYLIRNQSYRHTSTQTTHRRTGFETRLHFFLFGNLKSLIKIVLSTTSILKSDHTGGYSRFRNSSFANRFFRIESTCAPLNCLPRTVRYPSLFNHSVMASKVIPLSRCSEMV